MTVTELAYDQFRTLPEAQAREVLDFIGYRKEKNERAEWGTCWAPRPSRSRPSGITPRRGVE